MKTVLAALALLFAAVVLPLVGQGDDETTRNTLAGLKGVHVLVESIKDEVQRDGLRESQIQTDVELKLRQAGITVLTHEEWLSTTAAPYLYVNVQVFKNPAHFYAYSANVELRQRVTLVHSPSTSVLATTWSAQGTIGTVGSQKVGSVRKTCATQLTNSSTRTWPRIPSGSGASLARGPRSRRGGPVRVPSQTRREGSG